MPRFFAFRNALTLAAVIFSVQLFSQTLIINEVSNGPAGNREYVEFVVTDTGAVYNCGTTTPPCLDIRGWIFDDNSGYHGAGGIAVGAVRFSNNVLWSCVPVGTIIVIYNDADPNANIPPVDLSLSDGNCRIIAPISSVLFETNLTTPGAVACSYPATGWTAGGNWSTTLLANGGDCARLVNLSGCEVFSVCWATDNLNTLIYFNSAGSGTDNVWFFNSGDPNNQLNWSEGCADPTACGADEQTPGLPNNAANAAFIAQFNNGCMPITPVSSSIASFTDASCSCDGTATVSTSGSIPGYTYAWYDVAMNFIGQTGTTATALCPGTYHVISTSSIGCTDTATVIIGSTGGSALTVSIIAPNDTTCSYGGPFALIGTPAGGTWSGTGISPTGQFAGSVTGVGTFTITYTATAGGCTGSTTIDIVVLPTNALHITPILTACVNDDPITFTATPPGGNFYGPGVPLTTDGVFDPGYGPGTYVIAYEMNLPGACYLWDSTFIEVIDTAVNITAVPPVCDDAAPFNLSATPAGGTWSGTGITNATLGTFDASVAGVGTHTITYTVGSGSCTGMGTINITVATGGVTVNIDPVTPVCETAAPFTLSATPSGGTWSGTGISPTGTFYPSVVGNGSYWIFYTVSTTGPCGGIDSVLIQVDDAPAVSISPVSPVCLDTPPFNLSSNIPGGVWSGTGITMADSGQFFPALAGVGTHTITYTFTNGACTSTATVNIQVVPAVNIVAHALGSLVFCQGGSVELYVSGAGSLPVSWSNGMSGDTITVSSGGNYFATVNSGCGAETSNTISVTVNTIDASFMPDPATGQSPLTVNLVNTTVNSSAYYWSVNDTVYAINTDTSITYDSAGYYQVTLYVVSPEGCLDSLTQTIYVYGEFAVIVPNIFTPNGDQVNDVFSIDLLGVSELRVDVFNRWGQAIHAYANQTLTEGKVAVWDGKAQNGDYVSDGVYAFVLKAKAYSGQEQVLKGFVTVIRSK